MSSATEFDARDVHGNDADQAQGAPLDEELMPDGWFLHHRAYDVMSCSGPFLSDEEEPRLHAAGLEDDDLYWEHHNGAW